MNRVEVLKISFRTLCKKGTIVTILLFAAAFYCLYSGIIGVYSLYIKMSEKVYIHCTIPEEMMNNLDKISELENIVYVTEIRETVYRLSFRGYYADVTLVGMDRQVLVECYTDVLAASPNGSMPYIVVDTSLVDRLKNDNKEKIKEMSEDDLLLKTVTLNGKEARVCGVVNVSDDTKKEADSNDESKAVYVYMTLEDYEKLTESLDKQQLNDSLNDEGKDYSNNYYIEIKSGFALDELLETFQKWGISVQLQDGDNISLEKWKREWGMAGTYMALYFIMLVCGMILQYYQKILWIKEHDNFIYYVVQGDKSGKMLRRVFRLRLEVCFLFGICGGGVIFFLSS